MTAPDPERIGRVPLDTTFMGAEALGSYPLPTNHPIGGEKMRLRTEGCVCGETIVADANNPEPEMRRHVAGQAHQLWIAIRFPAWAEEWRRGGKMR